MEEKKFIASDLKRIAFVVIGILILFGVLYYVESNFGALTKLLP